MVAARHEPIDVSRPLHLFLSLMQLFKLWFSTTFVFVSAVDEAVCKLWQAALDRLSKIVPRTLVVSVSSREQNNASTWSRFVCVH